MKTKLLTLALATAVLTACSSVKAPAVSGSAAYDPAAKAPFPTIIPSSTSVSGNAWTDLKLPVSISLKAPASLSASGTLTMERDRYVDISLRMLGFEIATLHITNDSVFAADKYHKYYLAESTRSLLKGFDASVGNIQSLLLGRIFSPGAPFGVVDTEAMDIVPTGDADLPGSVLLIPKTTAASGFTLSFVEDTAPAVPLLLATAFVAGTADAVVLRYSGILSGTRAGDIATAIDIDGNAGKTRIAASVQLKAANARWDSGATAQWRTPRGYKRISGAELLKALRP